MRKLLLIASLMAIPVLGNAQTYFFDDFNDQNVSNWTRYDADGDGKQWADYFTVNDGSGNPVTPVSLISRSWEGAPLTPDNWIVSPAINLTAATGQAVLTWKVMAAAATWDNENYSVYVATSNTIAGLQASPVTFTETYNDPGDDGTQYTRTLDISSLVGQTVYVAFRHHNVTDMDFISIDDVTVKKPAAVPPSCATPTAPLNGATGINYKQPLTLTWTAPASGEVPTSYDVFFGTTANPTTLLVNTTSLTATVPVTAMAGATTYYWKVVPKNEAGSATGCADFSFTTANPPTAAPNCATLTTPANGATAVDYLAPLTLSWTAPTTGTMVDSYDVYFGTTANPTTLLVNTTATTATVPVTQLAASTTYYWKVVPKNDTGAATGCTEFSFTTAANPFAPYCGPLVITSNTEPITSVNFAGINNVSDATLNGSPDHENFTTIVGNVTAGNSYTMTLKGNTGGNWVNRFVVFIDWNQNGVLNDAGEVYQITQTITNSTGTDAIQAVQSLAVPATAMAGNTRMRVKKIFGTTNYLDPCAGASFGQAEDYTLNVSTLGVNDSVKEAVKVYPNPVVDMLNIDSPAKVKSITIFDVTGRSVSTHVLNAAKSQVNLSGLAAGVYMVNIQMENETKTVKVVKK